MSPRLVTRVGSGPLSRRCAPSEAAAPEFCEAILWCGVFLSAADLLWLWPVPVPFWRFMLAQADDSGKFLATNSAGLGERDGQECSDRQGRPPHAERDRRSRSPTACLRRRSRRSAHLARRSAVRRTGLEAADRRPPPAADARVPGPLARAGVHDPVGTGFRNSSIDLLELQQPRRQTRP